MWRNLFFLAGIPAIVLVNINAFYFEDQHPKRADFLPFDYLRKRQKVYLTNLITKFVFFNFENIKRYPWGDGNHTLFHNEYYNALPDGYETDDDWLEKHGHGGHH